MTKRVVTGVLETTAVCTTGRALSPEALTMLAATTVGVPVVGPDGKKIGSVDGAVVEGTALKLTAIVRGDHQGVLAVVVQSAFDGSFSISGSVLHPGEDHAPSL